MFNTVLFIFNFRCIIIFFNKLLFVFCRCITVWRSVSPKLRPWQPQCPVSLKRATCPHNSQVSQKQARKWHQNHNLVWIVSLYKTHLFSYELCDVQHTSLDVLIHIRGYRIQSNYRPCPHNRSPSWLFTLFSLIIAHLTIFFLTIYFIFTYYRPLDDLLALVVENKFT